jgi:hypothetical protein
MVLTIVGDLINYKISPHIAAEHTVHFMLLVPKHIFGSTIKTVLILTLVDLQFVAQNSYLFKYNTFIKILYMFRALLCLSSGGLRCNCIYAASGIVTL